MKNGSSNTRKGKWEGGSGVHREVINFWHRQGGRLHKRLGQAAVADSVGTSRTCTSLNTSGNFLVSIITGKHRHVLDWPHLSNPVLPLARTPLFQLGNLLIKLGLLILNLLQMQ